jgi:diguanylate cyclase (GGDEF)-like protein
MLERFQKAGLQLPSPPAIAMRILQAVKSQEPSFRELGRIIAADPALTAKLLKVANSSFYALPSKVTSIDKALAVLGVTALKNIALSFVIAKDLGARKAKGFDFELFWKRAVTAGVAAELLSKQLGRRNEDAFVSGILQDLGIMLLLTNRGEEYAALLVEKAATKRSLQAIERERLGFDHQQLSAELLADWGLPPSIVEPIRHHHDPAQATPEFRPAAEVLGLASQISGLYHGRQRTEAAARVKYLLSSTFGMSEADTAWLIDQVAAQTIDILSSFEIDPGDLKPYSELLQDANAELGQLNLAYGQLVVELRQAKDEAEKLAADLRQANARLQELVSRDGLTGLHNHRYFQEVMDRELSRAERYGHSFSLILFDIDHFKKVNDTFGHQRGDQVLKLLSALAVKAVRTSDVVARYGGEEFAVVLPETPESGVGVFAERLRRGVEQLKIVVDELTIPVTISLGATTYHCGVHRHDKSALIEAADQALYQSKRGGRNRVTVLAPPAR